MSAWDAVKFSIIAAAVGFILGFGLLSELPEPTGPISENVRWKIENTTVYGTITRPRDLEGPLPAVLFIAGSGPTNRDWVSPLLKGTNGSGELLAEVLASQGYVTLRYDKRTTGRNALLNVAKMIGKISMASHVDEVSGAMDLLTARTDVDPNRIYVLTNSEGAVHAMNYDLSDPAVPFAGFLLTAPPGRTVQEVAETQVQLMLADSDNAEELFASYTDAVDAILHGDEFSIDPNLPKGASILLQGLSAPVNQPFARELLSVDIAPWLANLDAPALVLIGQKDIQIDWILDGERLEAQAAGNPQVTFAYPEDANHVLKFEPKPREDLTSEDGTTYNLASKVLDLETVDLIVTWLQTVSDD